MKWFIPILFFMLALVGMAAALHFAKYKKRPNGCCGAHTHCTHQHHSKEKPSEQCSNGE